MHEKTLPVGWHRLQLCSQCTRNEQKFTTEVKRLPDLHDKHLANHRDQAGDQFSVADMVAWPRYGAVVLGIVSAFSPN